MAVSPFLRKLRHALVAGFALFVVAAVGLTAWSVYSDREERLRADTLQSETLARALEEHVLRTFDGVDLLLAQAAAEFARRGGVRSQPSGRVHDYLRARLASLPQVRGYFVFGPDNFLYALSASREVPRVDGTKLDFIAAHAAGRGDALFIGRTTTGHVTGRPLIPVTRRLETPGGGYGGVVGASLEPEYFGRFYRALGLNEEQTLGLFRRDGQLVMRIPEMPADISRELADSTLFRQGLARSPSGTLRFSGAVDRRERVIAFRAIENLGLVVSIGYLVEPALADWRLKAWTHFAVLGGGLVLAALMLAFALVQLRRREADDALLRQSEDRFRKAFQASPAAMAVIAFPEGQYLDVNDAWLAIYGYERGEVLGRSSLEFGLWADSAERASHYESLERSGSLHGNTVRHRRKSGEIAQVVASSELIEIGGRRCLLAFLYDVTESRRHEAELRASEARFRAIFEQAGVGVAQVDSQSGRFLIINRKYCDMVGYCLEEMRSKEVWDITYAEDVPADLACMARLRAGEIATYSVEKRYVHKSGGVVWVTVSVSAMWRAGETPSTHISVAADITPLKMAEEAFRSSELRLRTIADQMPVLIGYVDAGQRLRFANRAYSEWYGVPIEQLPGKSIRELLGDEEYERARPNIEAALRSSSTVRWEREAVLGGRRRHVRATYLPDIGAGGQARGYYVLAEDVTEFKLAEARIRELNESLEGRVLERTAELQAANRQLESFSYSISHDLRAPLRAIAGFSQVLLEEAHESLAPQHRAGLDRVVKNVHRMSALIDDLLEFARTSRTAMNASRFPLRKLVDEVVGALKEGYPRTAVEIGDLPEVSGDRSLLRQAVLNLLANAFKFSATGEAPRIEIGCAERDGEMVCYVRDNGVGFDMAYCDKLFGVFQRLHRAEEFEGTGVGLAIVSQVIGRHGGRVWAESAPGAGATFHFTLGKSK